MRRLKKETVPDVLAQNASSWTSAYVADPTNRTKKFRYRHPDIKAALLLETSQKCIYCESKVGHNTPGDVEHKIPSSQKKNLHFEWANLTIACSECNRRKLDYFDEVTPFIDPYCDDVESRVLHHGPIVGWAPGDASAEASIKTLELHNGNRQQLITRKVETIDSLNNLVARVSTAQGVIKEMLRISLEKMRGLDSEFSGMIKAICVTYKIE